jgi:hypothetical protein
VIPVRTDRSMLDAPRLVQDDFAIAVVTADTEGELHVSPAIDVRRVALG